jgi:small subunit ribosomal protein S18
MPPGYNNNVRSLIAGSEPIKIRIDYKNVDDLRRMMTPNGKIYSRKRLGVNAREQREIARAIKRARYMSLLPYTSATL